ncbi:hypothetical protein OIV19_08695 [Brucella sp. HL-2]|nr:hypothetical protein [Brucella sp. HL-2]MCV9907691.1 hypothetical protein [Brucella sp. HL-2]
MLYFLHAGYEPGCLQNDLPNMTLYGTEATLYVPEPNIFDGIVRITNQKEAAGLPAWDHPLGPPTRTENSGRMVADYRSAGLADMAQAII